MKIVVIGVDHTIQHLARAGAREDYVDNSQREMYERLLRRKISEHQPQFIGEETHTRYGVPIGKQVADSLRPPLPWANIDMPEEDRKKRGISERLGKRSVNPKVGPKGVWLDTEDRVEGADDEREEYWIARTIEGATNANAPNALIICGEQHVEELRKKLCRDGHVVITDCLRKYDWYWKNQLMKFE